MDFQVCIQFVKNVTIELVYRNKFCNYIGTSESRKLTVHLTESKEKYI